MPTEKFQGPLTGIRVLDLSQAAAGPYGSMILADLGAEVIKVESHEGDMDRRMPGPNYKGQPYYHLAVNRNKKSIVLNLRTRTGREAFLDLVKVSDVVWDNFRAGAVERLGIDFDSLKKVNPRIITCCLTGFGTSGPLRDRPSFDIIGLAVSGILSITGEAGRAPVRPGPPLGDQALGLFGVIGTISALYHRERTGKGQRVDIAMLDACLSLMVFNLAHYLTGGRVLGREGSRHLSVVPYGVFETRKGYLAIGPSWPRIARVIGAEWMIDDPRFTTNELRLQNRELLEKTIQEKLLEGEARDWFELMKVEDIPAAVVNDESQVVAEPQVMNNHMLLTLKHPLGGEVKTIGNPVKMPRVIDEESYNEGYTPAPLLGQHQAEVILGLLGYPRKKFDALMAEEKAAREELEASLHKKF